MSVVPPVSLSVRPEFLVATKEIRNKIGLEVHALKNVQLNDARVHIQSPSKDEDLANPGTIQLQLAKNQARTYEVDGPAFPASGPLNYYVKSNSADYGQNMIAIRHDHIPSIIYFKPVQVPLASMQLATYGKRIGYIIGAGDKVPQALEQMGYDVTLLTDKELSRNSLTQFDAIMTGVRAYNTNEWMNNHYDKLMKYVSDGGNLIVQYNTSNNIGPVRAKISPYNFTIARQTRITDENAPVTLLKSDHAVLNFPNKITQEDFRGWVQERSIYHAAGWDSTKFETVISMQDPGEKPDAGGLIIARHGKGVFVYTGLVFFRELPAGVPGAYRLLANIIALNRKKSF
ncbi:MAG: hypothetical protein H7Y42_10685 [Chitinophagaceae bacterium]|nr:hypothetical protein [Chitinophagaceae bacterium]